MCAAGHGAGGGAYVMMRSMFKAIAELGAFLVFPNICEICKSSVTAGAGPVCVPCRTRMKKIAPPFCPGCGRTSAGPDRLCGQCGHGARPFDRAYAAFYYEGVTRELLHAYKYKERRSLEKIFAAALSDFVAAHLDTSEIDAVVSVPMDAPKTRRRGFNQSRLLCARLARSAGLPDLSGGFARRRSRGAQSLLRKSERAKNIAGSFFVKKPGTFAGKNVLLVDDVLTTGFTASECASTLKADGAASVTVLAAARGE